MRQLRFALAFVFLVTAGGSWPAPASAAEDAREVEARALFAKGDYEPALDIYAKLFAEKNDPLYLRNIGRCYQKLKNPDKSIDAFKEYLRRGKIKSRERDEVNGFIKEMEDLKAQQAAAPPVAPPPPAPVTPVEPTRVAAPPPAAPPPVAATAAPAVTLAAGSGEGSAESTPITHRWWFWAGIGAVVVGGVVTAIVLSSGGSDRLPCPSGTVCPTN